MNSCLVCKRISMIKRNKNRFFVKELLSGYVVLGDYQYYKGYTLLLSKTHTDELHKLKRKIRIQFLKDMAVVAEAVYKAFKPKKLNYELLGNTDSHLHWHIIPRYRRDLRPSEPIWVIDRSIRCAKNTIPSNNQLEKIKQTLLVELDKLTNQT